MGEPAPELYSSFGPSSSSIDLESRVLELERELEGEREVREALALRVVSLQQELSRMDSRLRALEHHHSFVASQLCIPSASASLEDSSLLHSTCDSGSATTLPGEQPACQAKETSHFPPTPPGLPVFSQPVLDVELESPQSKSSWEVVIAPQTWKTLCIRVLWQPGPAPSPSLHEHKPWLCIHPYLHHFALSVPEQVQNPDPHPCIALCLHRYVKVCLAYFGFLSELGKTLQDLSQTDAVECVFLLHRSSEEESSPTFENVHPTNTLKALRWLIRTVQLHFPDTYSGLFRTLSQPAQCERKESVPLPLDFVAYLEFLVLSMDTLPLDRLLAGSLLVCIWASLRFGDASHVLWSSLIYDNGVLRGVAHRTKTSSRGMPFALHGIGLYGDWASGYLVALHELWNSLALRSPAVPDYLFFVSALLDGNQDIEDFDTLFAPATYAFCLKKLRLLLSSWGRLSPQQISNYTLHSCKSTLLSWAAQQTLPVSFRKQQGHHRSSDSATLYGRDDVYLALETRSPQVWVLRAFGASA
ncbi:unnamed protein product [Symbiodinium natans]|uniref:Uncharacterized protein n=1 Tax=Symbiodinium natans TaxID=878477 RepID=A0A812PFV5_9DINO|nr:unnamed protein product [Symbiodinium natans]